MKKFEYNILKMDVSGGFFSQGGIVDIDALQDELDRLGNVGWELVNTVDTAMSQGKSRELVLILKREAMNSK